MPNIQCHNPSKKATRFGRFWDFFFRKSALYDKKYDIGSCAFCGVKIQVPQRYHKIATWHYLLISLLSLVIMNVCAAFLLNMNPKKEFYFVICLLLFFGIPFLVLRVVNAIILSSNEWREIPPDHSDAFYAQAREIAYLSWKRRFWVGIFILLLLF